MSIQHSKLWTPTMALACLANFAIWTAGYGQLGTLTLNALALGAPEAQVGWYPASSSVFALVAQLVGGRLLAGRPRAPIVRLGTILTALASLLGIVALSAPTLFAIVALFAIGYGLMQSGIILLITETAPPNRRGQAVGLFGTFITMGVVLGPPSATALLQHFGGQAVYGLMLVMTLAAVGCTLLLREPPPRPARAGEEGSGRLHPLALAAALTMFGLTWTWGAVLAFLPLYALELGLANPGFYFTAQAVGVLSMRMAAGGLSDRFGRVQVLVPAMILVALGVGGLAIHPSVPVLFLLAVVYGVGYAAIHPTTIAVADDVSTNASRGVALGLVGGMFSIGVGAGAASMGYVLQHTSFEFMFLTAAMVPLATTAIFVWTWRVSRRPAPVNPQPSTGAPRR